MKVKTKSAVIANNWELPAIGEQVQQLTDQASAGISYLGFRESL